MHITRCCVFGCKNNSKNSSCKFYSFPTASHRMQQRLKWVEAIQNNIRQQRFWTPKKYERLCSDHFIGKAKSEVVLSPSYVPRIFSKKNLPQTRSDQSLARHLRFMNRCVSVKKVERNADVKVKSQQNKSFTSTDVNDINMANETNMYNREDNNEEMEPKTKCDESCQVDFLPLTDVPNKLFVCNRYCYSNKNVCDAETYTEINTPIKVTVPIRSKCCDKSTNTVRPTYVDKEAGPTFETTAPKGNGFEGYVSITNEEQLLDLAGVTYENFNVILSRAPDSGKGKVSKENKLLIFLLKLKTNLTFSAIAVLFSLSRQSIANIFFSHLKQIADSTQDFVGWPSRDVIQLTMPNCFKKDFGNTRVIIDCTEFRIDTPKGVDNRVWCYSQYKKGFTAKVLIGMSPGGLITFKSKVCGGRKSDSQITVESGILDLLEDGDVVLADKGFPEFKTVIGTSGKKVLLVMPPFLCKNTQFTQEETESTYKIASVRIHVERIMQRLRTYNIFNKIPHYLFQHLDDVVQVCCALVNLQPPIIAEPRTE